MDATKRRMTLAAQTFQEQPNLLDEAQGSAEFTKLRETSRQVTLDGDVRRFIVEGDLLYDEDELRLYALRRKTRIASQRIGLSPATETAHADQLVVVASGGRMVRWRPGKVLTHCVLQASFPTKGQYELVCANMAAATTDWMRTCGVEFQHLGEFDGHRDIAASPDEISADLVFTVRYIDAGGEFIAAAFFPTYPPARRQILIDPSYFSEDLPFDRVGVLRHELGHVIGCRHEAIRSEAPPTCPKEPDYDTINLTDYDPQSVMHYFCGGVGSRQLAITELDRVGAQKLYGPPFSSLLLAD